MQRPEMPRTRFVNLSVPEHEVLLVFNDDEAAARFADWIGGDGWQAFEGWCREMESGIRAHEGTTRDYSDDPAMTGHKVR